MKIFVATPAYNQSLTTTYFNSFFGMVREFSRRRILVTTAFRYSSLLPRSRNELVADFLHDSGATHLLFWDADIGIEPDVLFQMIDFGKPVVGVACPMKDYHWERMGPEGSKERHLLDFNIDYGNSNDPANQGSERQGPFAKVTSVGTGFLLIQRSTFNQMAERLPELQYSYRGRKAYAFFDTSIHDPTREYISEDISFCHRWVNRCSGEIWCHMEATVTHIGINQFVGRFFD